MDLPAVAAAVQSDRVLRRLDELAAIGGEPGGGVTRIAFSEEEREATALIGGWLRDAGMTLSFDPFGNMFASSDGNRDGATVSMAGSHLDTVPHGGRYDGALGVVAAVESVLAMQAAGYRSRRPLEVVVWRCEEPVRFTQGKVGSLLFSGALSERDLRAAEDPPLDLAAAIRRDGDRPQRAPNRAIATCLELHIEQGRRLERAERQLGVVTAVAAPIRLRIDIHGSADHSGATPMHERRDALCAAAELVLAVEQAARAESTHGTVATAANIVCRPGVINVIPGEAGVFVDVRGIDAPSMERVVSAVIARGEAVAAERAVEIATVVLSRAQPTVFPPEIVGTLDEVCTALGYSTLRMPSGAGHDTQCLAGQAAVGMLFVPSVGGISHSPQEYTAPDDLVAGVRAHAACWAALSAR